MKVITIDEQVGIWVPIKQAASEPEVLVACGWTGAGHPGVRRSNEEVTRSWPDHTRPKPCDLAKLCEINASIYYHKVYGPSEP
jgi:hypothetical protein